MVAVSSGRPRRPDRGSGWPTPGRQAGQQPTATTLSAPSASATRCNSRCSRSFVGCRACRRWPRSRAAGADDGARSRRPWRVLRSPSPVWMNDHETVGGEIKRFCAIQEPSGDQTGSMARPDASEAAATSPALVRVNDPEAVGRMCRSENGVYRRAASPAPRLARICPEPSGLASPGDGAGADIERGRAVSGPSVSGQRLAGGQRPSATSRSAGFRYSNVNAVSSGRPVQSRDRA